MSEPGIVPYREPRVVSYRTIYAGRERRVMASDAYNAAANRVSKDTGQRWTCCETFEPGHLFVVRRGKKFRCVDVL